MNRRAAFFIATDENGVDPRQRPHDTARLGRARHSPGGAAPAVATKQIGPASRRSQPAECTPADPAVRSEGPLATGRMPAVDKI